MMVELPESAAQAAIDPNRVYYVGAGYNRSLLPGLLFFSNEALSQTVPRSLSSADMLDGLRHGLVGGLAA